jgi:hypothetical protein
MQRFLQFYSSQKRSKNPNFEVLSKVSDEDRLTANLKNGFKKEILTLISQIF